jgi:hypothetical protein
VSADSQTSADSIIVARARERRTGAAIWRRAARRATDCTRGGRAAAPRTDESSAWTVQREDDVADIKVERKPRSPLPVILGIVLLAVVGYVVWKYVLAHP